MDTHIYPYLPERRVLQFEVGLATGEAGLKQRVDANEGVNLEGASSNSERTMTIVSASKDKGKSCAFSMRKS